MSARSPVPPSGRLPGAVATVEPRSSILPPGERERRRPRPDRRRADRRTADLGSPYGVERRSGLDDRLADRRGGSKGQAGIGLARDYFAQADERVAVADEAVPAGSLVRFHD